MSYNQKKCIYFISLSYLFEKGIPLKRYYYWLNHEEITFPFFKDYEKLRSSFLGYFLRVFCSDFVSSVTHNHMYPHVFPLHWIKGIWYNLFLPSLFSRINDNRNWGETLWLKKVGPKDIWGEIF